MDRCLFAVALLRGQGPVELDLYPSGRHGLELSPEDSHIATWVDLASQWLQGVGW